MATARFVWLGMLIAVGAYVLVLAVLLDSGAAPVADVTALRRALMFVTVGVVVVLFWFRRRLPLEAFGGERPTPSVQEVTTTYVVCWALSESVALFGVVLGMLSRSIGEAYPFFVVAAALLVWQRPRAEHFGERR